MFVASSTQFRRLLTSSTAQNVQQQRFLNSKKLLDVGAGDGLVTLKYGVQLQTPNEFT